MRDICLVTFYKDNYGSMLQSLAFTKILARRGYRVRMLNQFKVRSFYVKHPVLAYARFVNRLTRKRRRAFFNPVAYEIPVSRKARLAEFAEDSFDEISFVSSGQWSDAIRSGMIFVAGSDIIWQPKLGYPSRYFLDFAVCAGLPCFSYASSIGAQELPRQYYKAYKRYLGAFEGIGVRENASVELLEPIVGKQVTKVVDPTLLLGVEEWNRLADKARLSVDVDSGGFVFCYFVMDDQRYWDYVKQVREVTGMQVIVLPMHHRDERQPYTIMEDGTPYEFLWLIKHADIVFTDSFHACVFSLRYEKEFYLMRRTRKSEDEKYNDFLGRYGLADRVIVEGTPFERVEGIDYSAARAQLELDCGSSNAFLDDVLLRIDPEAPGHSC